MSIRWIAVQYVGDALRLPVVNGGDMDKPFGSSVLERDVRRIVVNPFSGTPQTFVPEAENAKLRELVRDYEHCNMHADCGRCEYDGKLSTHCPLSPCFPDADELRDLGVEVDA